MRNRGRRMRGVGTGVLLFATMAALTTPSDVSGTWTGTIRNPGASDAQAGHLVLHLTQHGTTVTGTAGNDESHQGEIQEGRVAGDSIKFDVRWGNTAHFSLASH